MFRLRFSRLLLCFLLAAGLFPVRVADAQQSTGKPVDVVFCLDLSSSANTLIDHFRNHLWDYWRFFSRCKPRPNFRIGVVAYSRFSYGKQTGYSKVIKDLGTDFERMSSILYKIPSRIEKGDQYVGAALKTCLTKVNWSKDPDAIKMIFLVGNGDVNLGPESVDKAVERLRQQEVMIHTIYCVAPGERKAVRGWQRIAQYSGGKHDAISLRTRYFDNVAGFNQQRFRALNRKFNATYLYYGIGGAKRWRMQTEEDNHIYVANTEGYRFRALYKISDDYQQKNHDWDLVDLYYRNPVAFMEVDRKTMNDSCKKMTHAQLKSYIIYKKYERKKLAALIADMVTEKELKDREAGRLTQKRMPTLDVVSLRMLREILVPRGIQCPEY